jgi:RNA polymerase I-specific transcription initiation factor RRN3
MKRYFLEQFCDESVSKQFALVASKTNFAFCYSILEQNRRGAYTGVVPTFVLPPSAAVPQSDSGKPTISAGISRTSSATGMSRSVFIALKPSSSASTTTRDTTAATIAELNSFFPFDPYELPLTRSYIDGVYRVWDEVKIVGDEEGETGSDDEDEEETDSDEAHSLSGDSTRVPIVVENTPAAGSSADDLNKSFGGMSISPLRRVDVSKSGIEMAA